MGRRCGPDRDILSEGLEVWRPVLHQRHEPLDLCQQVVPLERHHLHVLGGAAIGQDEDRRTTLHELARLHEDLLDHAAFEMLHDALEAGGHDRAAGLGDVVHACRRGPADKGQYAERHQDAYATQHALRHLLVDQQRIDQLRLIRGREGAGRRRWRESVHAGPCTSAAGVVTAGTFP
ncbi:hypothetical protein [Teichococcus aestuarii]|uniref:hypothetical protein n=1 Tax=Teichococcus aestuarii TaxID=568898 RepID=UPI0036136213